MKNNPLFLQVTYRFLSFFTWENINTWVYWYWGKNARYGYTRYVFKTFPSFFFIGCFSLKHFLFLNICKSFLEFRRVIFFPSPNFLSWDKGVCARTRKRVDERTSFRFFFLFIDPKKFPERLEEDSTRWSPKSNLPKSDITEGCTSKILIWITFFPFYER